MTVLDKERIIELLSQATVLSEKEDIDFILTSLRNYSTQYDLLNVLDELDSINQNKAILFQLVITSLNTGSLGRAYMNQYLRLYKLSEVWGVFKELIELHNHPMLLGDIFARFCSLSFPKSWYIDFEDGVLVFNKTNRFRSETKIEEAVQEVDHLNHLRYELLEMFIDMFLGPLESVYQYGHSLSSLLSLDPRFYPEKIRDRIPEIEQRASILDERLILKFFVFRH